MTISEDEIKQLIKDGENIFVDFKAFGYINKGNSDDIANDITAFANRYGGKLLIGVCDNGTPENNSIKNGELDKIKSKFVHISTCQCSPIVNLLVDKVTIKNSDIIVIDIKKRNDIPHAVIHKTNNGEIKSRDYYIRTDNSNKLVEDILLKFLFNNIDDPDLSISINFIIWFTNKKSPYCMPNIRTKYSEYIDRYLNTLKESPKYQNLDGEELFKTILKILPYAFLDNLSFIFRLS